MTAPVALYRYYLPNDRPLEGWAEIVIGSNGFFAAVSDFGNYAFLWRHHGCADAREFFLKAERDWDYFARKLGGENAWEFDGERTLQNVKDYILSSRRSRDMTAKQAKREWELLDLYDVTTPDEFEEWMDATSIEAPYEFDAKCIRQDLQAFCKRTLPRLARVLRDELAAPFREKSAVWFRGVCHECGGRRQDCGGCPF